MALFAKKSKSSADDTSQAMPTAPNANPGFTGTQPGETDDLAAANDSAANGAASRLKKGARAPKASKPARVAKGIKGGVVVGLNIGNDSIKAIELRSRGSEVVVTAAGMIPTPVESLSDGLVMSPAALSSAIRELFAQSGIRTRSAITSVAGGGALVVRVLEVPKMSDAELAENMNMDLERYVPFPPADVVKDFRALRELPSDPDAPNMEVLLAAVRNETIDLHLKVLQGAKLEPQAIDVEPLAAARSLFYGSARNFQGDDGSNTGLTPDVATDYNDATALINIGATSTEISVLRGDVLVFTRSVPVAGNALTQALADHFGMSTPEAERLKREIGDALPPQVVAPQAAVPDAAADDWSAFGEDEVNGEDANANFGDATGFENADDEIHAAHNVATTNVAVEDESQPVNVADDDNAVGSDDPFDQDMFNRGPLQNEPQEGHRQKQGGDKPPYNFDLSRFNFTEDEREIDNDIPTDPVEPEASTARTTTFQPPSSTGNAPEAVQSGASVPSGDNESNQALPSLEFPMAGEEGDLTMIAPSGQMYGLGSADDPELPTFPSLPSISSATSSATDASPTSPVTSLQMPDGLMAPGSEQYVAEESEDLLPTVSEDASLSALDESDLSTLPSMGTSEEASATSAITPGASTVSGAPVFDFSSPIVPDAGGDDFDSAFASMISAPAVTPTETLTTNAPIQTSETVPGAAEFVSTPGSETSAYEVTPVAVDTTSAAAPSSDFDLDQFAGSSSVDDSFGLEDFGLGLGGDEGTTPASVHAILQPRLAELVNEVRRSLEYYASRYPDAGVRRIVLVGGGACLPNMDSLMTQEIGIPSTVQNSLARVTVEAKGLPADFVDQNGAAFAVALGLALRDVVS